MSHLLFFLSANAFLRALTAESGNILEECRNILEGNENTFGLKNFWQPKGMFNSVHNFFAL